MVPFFFFFLSGRATINMVALFMVTPSHSITPQQEEEGEMVEVAVRKRHEEFSNIFILNLKTTVSLLQSFLFASEKEKEGEMEGVAVLKTRRDKEL